MVLKGANTGNKFILVHCLQSHVFPSGQQAPLCCQGGRNGHVLQSLKDTQISEGTGHKTDQQHVGRVSAIIEAKEK